MTARDTAEKAVRRVLVLACLSLAAQQILHLVEAWNERPFDYVLDEDVAKHEVMFPSVTVCPEGSTVWPAMEANVSAKIY